MLSTSITDVKAELELFNAFSASEGSCGKADSNNQPSPPFREHLVEMAISAQGLPVQPACLVCEGLHGCRAAGEDGLHKLSCVAAGHRQIPFCTMHRCQEPAGLLHQLAVELQLFSQSAGLMADFDASCSKNGQIDSFAWTTCKQQIQSSQATHS